MFSEELIPVKTCKACPDSLVNVLASEFQYDGTILGTFAVINANLLKCFHCGEKWYLRSEARRWELEKAKEIIRRGNKLTSKELKFLAQIHYIRYYGDMYVSFSFWATEHKIVLSSEFENRIHQLRNDRGATFDVTDWIKLDPNMELTDHLLTYLKEKLEL